LGESNWEVARAMTYDPTKTPALIAALQKTGGQLRASDLQRLTGVPKKFVRRALTDDRRATRPIAPVKLTRRGGFWLFSTSTHKDGMRPRYWAVVAVPGVYNLDAALAETDEHVWTTKRSAVRKGDRLALWRGLKDGHRGVVAFAEVMSDPAVVGSPPEYKRFWNIEPPHAPEPRVRIKFVRSPRLPLWIDSPHGRLLKQLTVSRGQGTVFRIPAQQWKRIVRAAGGWIDATRAASAPSVAQWNRTIDAYDQIASRKVRTEQRFLRKYVLNGAASGPCALCRRKFPVDLLVAAHIKQRAECTPRERADYRRNVVAMCKLGCDDLFERGYLSAVAGGWVAHKGKVVSATPAVRQYIATVVDKPCSEWADRRGYFAWHNRRHDFGDNT
jgi:hypothetical protein